MQRINSKIVQIQKYSNKWNEWWDECVLYLKNKGVHYSHKQHHWQSSEKYALNSDLKILLQVNYNRKFNLLLLRTKMHKGVWKILHNLHYCFSNVTTYFIAFTRFTFLMCKMFRDVEQNSAVQTSKRFVMHLAFILSISSLR